jgi:hypothetical protein
VALKGLRHPVAVHALVLPTRPLVGGVGVQA